MQLELNLNNDRQAPEGFYAVEKKYKGYNICRDCDARKLCQKNEQNWCAKNPCMDYSREDGKSVIFKKL